MFSNFLLLISGISIIFSCLQFKYIELLLEQLSNSETQLEQKTTSQSIHKTGSNRTSLQIRHL